MTPRVYFLAALVALAFAAGWFGNGWRLNSQHQAETIRALEAGRKAVEKHDAESKAILEDYREKLSVAVNRKPRRVYICPGTDLPAPAGGAPGSGPAGVDRHDYGPDIRACGQRLLQLNALIADWTNRSKP